MRPTITAGQKNLPPGPVRVMPAPHDRQRSFVQEDQQICYPALWNKGLVCLFFTRGVSSDSSIEGSRPQALSPHYPLPALPSDGGLRGGAFLYPPPISSYGLASNSANCLKAFS